MPNKIGLCSAEMMVPIRPHIWPSVLDVAKKRCGIEKDNYGLTLLLVLDRMKISEKISSASMERREAWPRYRPRSAAALLRLSTEKLVRRLCEEGEITYKDLNAGIAELVKKGLPITIQRALDILRVTGNEAVHPGQIDFEDNSETVMSLFEFLNLIAYDRITQPKRVADHYATLAKAKRERINDRDATSSVGN